MCTDVAPQKKIRKVLLQSEHYVLKRFSRFPAAHPSPSQSLIRKLLWDLVWKHWRMASKRSSLSGCLKSFYLTRIHFLYQFVNNCMREWTFKNKTSFFSWKQKNLFLDNTKTLFKGVLTPPQHLQLCIETTLKQSLALTTDLCITWWKEKPCSYFR